MTTIRQGGSPVTLINVFAVAPEHQRELVRLLDEATRQTMRGQQGFVSANIHASLDGTHVVNYAQWETRDHFEAMLRDPAAREHFGPIQEIARSEPGLYEVVSVHER